MLNISQQILTLLIPILIYSCFITTILTSTVSLKSSNDKKIEIEKTSIKLVQGAEKTFEQVKGEISIWTGKSKPNSKNDPTKLLKEIFNS